jgi:hypothetical protein
LQVKARKAGLPVMAGRLFLSFTFKLRAFLKRNVRLIVLRRAVHSRVGARHASPAEYTADPQVDRRHMCRPYGFLQTMEVFSPILRFFFPCKKIKLSRNNIINPSQPEISLSSCSFLSAPPAPAPPAAAACLQTCGSTSRDTPVFYRPRQ